ncbi:MAG: hypothetical protein KC422_06570 [Trueperaceae bacterium]|nr:hypothetical protein [Trueperaceae bacterium]
MRKLILLMTLFGFAFAQDYSGTFVQQDDPSTVITLELQQEGYTGTLLNRGTDEFGIEASVQEGYLSGFLLSHSRSYGDMFFLAETTPEGFNLAVAPLDEQGNPIETAVETYVFIRQQSSGTSAETATKPLSSPVDVQQNPLATVSFAGSYKGQTFDLVLAEQDGQYSGTLFLNGQSLRLEATVSATTLAGSFFADGQAFPFEARLEGNSLRFISEGESYLLSKQSDTSSPVSSTTTESPAVPGQGVQTLSYGQRYQAGTDLLSPWTGVSFSVPQGHTAFFEPEYGVFLMTSLDGSSLLALEAASNARAEDLGYYAVEALAETLSPDDPRFQLVTAPSQSGDLITAQFYVAGTSLSAAAKQGSAGNAAVVIAYGAQAEQLIQTVANSFQFSRPQNEVAQWQKKLVGIHLYATRASSDITSTPSTLGSQASQGDYQYDFCSDGSFKHSYSDVAYYSVMDSTQNEAGYYMTASYKSGSEGSYQGTWTLISMLMGNPLLILESTEGGIFLHYIEETTEGALIDGRHFEVSSSQLCD